MADWNFTILLALGLVLLTNQQTDERSEPPDDANCPCASNSCSIMGAPGIPGQNGMHGKDGPPGVAGPPGLPGVQGARGDQGHKGSRGKRGEPGLTGRPGIQGISGIGMPGDKGEKGEPGGTMRFSRHTAGKTNTAFSVTRSNKLGPVTDDTHVLFDKIYSNLGQAFNTHKSEFVAKDSGSYMFHLHVMSQEGTDCNAWIMLNSTHHVPIYSDGRRGYGMASTTVIIDLSKDDKVWIQLITGSTMMNDYTTFTGYLIGRGTA